MIFASIKRIFDKLQSQINIVIALSIYERERKSSESAVGAWEPLMQPLQLLLFLLVIRIGLKLLLKSPGNVLSMTLRMKKKTLSFSAAARKRSRSLRSSKVNGRSWKSSI